MPYRRCRAQRPPAAGDLARAVAELRRRPPARGTAARSCAARSTSASRTSTSPTTTARRYGCAEIELRAHLRARTSRPYRDELIISTKAGYDMWPGPVRRVGLAQVPAREPRPEPRSGWGSTTSTSSTRTASTRTRRSRRRWARSTRAVRQGKALYVGISLVLAASGPRRRSRSSRELGTPLLIHQPSYSMLNRWIEDGLLDVLERAGRRRDRVLAARAGAAHRPLPRRRPGGLARAPRRALRRASMLTEENLARVRALNEIADAPRPVARADGDRLGAARSARHARR